METYKKFGWVIAKILAAGFGSSNWECVREPLRNRLIEQMN